VSVRLHVRDLSTPTPRVLYVHDDLTSEVTAAHGADSDAARLTTALFDLLRADGRVVVLTLAEQIDGVIADAHHEPFGLTIASGAAGERVARAIHARTGWFPAITRVDVTREEQEDGSYRLVRTSGEPIAGQLTIGETPSVAVVDDTVFSGLTLRAVLVALPATVRARAHAFCLRAVAESRDTVRALCPVAAGVAAPGKILDEVSFINASGLARRGAIRRAGAPPLAFFEREEWMRAWFPGYADEVTRLCRQLNASLDA
jgi:hypothetical protein